MQKISLIAALDRQNAIGKANTLPWHLPEDLKRFKALTLNKPIVMGRKTAESIGRALPKRRNIVLSRTGALPFSGMETASSLEEVISLCGDLPEVCVIGGGEIYKLALPLATHLYLSHIETIVENADAFFPDFDATQWKIIEREKHAHDEKHAFGFEFIDYEKHGS